MPPGTADAVASTRASRGAEHEGLLVTVASIVWAVALEPMPRIVVLDYGSGNLRSAERALRAGRRQVAVTADPDAAQDADGLVVPGVGAFAACMAGIEAVHGPRIIGRRLAGGRPVLGICVGMQILFERGVEQGERTEGWGQWPGTVERLKADVLPHMGWNTVHAPAGSALFAGPRPRDPLLLRALATRCGSGSCQGRRPAPAARHLGRARRALRRGGGERRALGHPVPPGEVRRRRRGRLLRNWLRGLVVAVIAPVRVPAVTFDV